MIISLIAAIDQKRGIGKDGKLPWRLSSDLKRFRELTMGHHLIVGRKTFESIGRALPGRHMIIVTRGVGVRPEGCSVTGSVQSALALARERGETEVFVIGGGEIYRQTIDLADRMYLTRVHADVGADVFFPEISSGAWTEIQRVAFPADEKNQYATEFTVLERHR